MLEIILVISIFVFITGACIGSFLNVVALRALSNESIVFPSSKCPVCKEPIKWYDNIPIFSYFFTFRGKCRNCGCKVSTQYPIVETVSALAFLFVYLFCGISIQSLLLLILICTSIVIVITDVKESVIYDRHSWVLIITAVIYSLYIKGLENYSFAAIGLIVGVVTMEVIAKMAYYLVKKKSSEEAAATEETAEKEEEIPQNAESESAEDENEEDINKYVEKNKRAFGEADTYLAAAAGAVLGWKYFLLALFCSIVLQALFILPQFMGNLWKEQERKLVLSITAFFILAAVYFGISNVITMNIFAVIPFIAVLIFLAIYSISRLKRTVNQRGGYSAMPFGPPLLITMFIVLFFGHNIAGFLNKYIFMMIG